MATQKNIKSTKSTVRKNKSSKIVAPKKAAAKAPVKGKSLSKPATASRSKVSVKKPVTVAKKVNVSKSKAVTKKVAKPAIKKAVTPKKPVKSISAAPKPKTQAKPVSKLVKSGKPIAKPVAKAQAKPADLKSKGLKAGPAPKSGVVGKAAAASKKPVAPRPAIQAKGKIAPSKPVISAGSSKTKAPAQPIAKAVSPVKKSEPKAIISKPITPASKPSGASGSKASDLTRKQSVSTTFLSAKHAEQAKAKATQIKSSKPIAGFTAKPYDKMLEKKEHKPPVHTTPSTEEPHKSRYSDKELEEFDQLIDQKLIVAREQLEFYLKQLEDMAENPDNKIKGLDDGLSTVESERISSMASRQQKLIQHLENAKIRIKNKVYGICRETGKLISKERLRAVPHATLSIEAKQAQN